MRSMFELDAHVYGLTDYVGVIAAAIILVLFNRQDATGLEKTYAIFGWTIVFVAISIPVHWMSGARTHLTVAMFGDAFNK